MFRFFTLVSAIFVMTLSVCAAGTPGWTVIPSVAQSDSEPGDVQLQCQGEGCAGGTLRCTVFSVASLVADGRINALINQTTPWGQIEFWLAHSFAQERHDLLNNLTDGAHFSVPVLRRIAEQDVATTHTTAQTQSGVVRLSVAFWIVGQRMHGLRCAYRQHADEDPAGRIDDLLAVRIATTRESAR